MHQQRLHRSLQTLHLDVHAALQRTVVDVPQVQVEPRQFAVFEGVLLQPDEGVAVAHTQGGAGLVTLAVEVGDIDMHDVAEGGAAVELDGAVHLGHEADAE